MDSAFGPDERAGVLVVGADEAFDVGHQFSDTAERGSVQRLARQDREPDFDLVQP